MGLFLGIAFASNTALRVTEEMSYQFDRDITAFTLTGMSEGWERGREYTEARMSYDFYSCVRELRRAYEIIAPADVSVSGDEKLHGVGE